VVIIGLGDIPVIFTQEIDMCRAKAVTSDNSALICLSTGDDIVGRSDLRCGRKLIECAIVCGASLEGITDDFHVLGVSRENHGDILDKINNASAI
jgi:hypothetical protein